MDVDVAVDVEAGRVEALIEVQNRLLSLLEARHGCTLAAVQHLDEDQDLVLVFPRCDEAPAEIVKLFFV